MKKQRNLVSLDQFLPADDGERSPVQAMIPTSLKNEVQDLLANDPRHLKMSDLITAAFRQYSASRNGVAK